MLGAEPRSIPHLEPGAEDALVLPHAYEDAARSRGPPVALRLSLPTGSAVPFHSSEELEDGAGEETDREAPQAHRQSASARTQEDDRPTEAKEPSAPRWELVGCFLAVRRSGLRRARHDWLRSEDGSWASRVHAAAQLDGGVSFGNGRGVSGGLVRAARIGLAAGSAASTQLAPALRMVPGHAISAALLDLSGENVDVAIGAARSFYSDQDTLAGHRRESITDRGLAQATAPEPSPTRLLVIDLFRAVPLPAAPGLEIVAPEQEVQPFQIPPGRLLRSAHRNVRTGGPRSQMSTPRALHTRSSYQDRMTPMASSFPSTASKRQLW